MSGAAVLVGVCVDVLVGVYVGVWLGSSVTLATSTSSVTVDSLKFPDCDRGGTVTVDELVTAANIALGSIFWRN